VAPPVSTCPRRGTSLGPVGSAEDVVVAVEDEIPRRVGAGQLAILGNSFGGMIARWVAHDLRPRVLGLATLAGVFVASGGRSRRGPFSARTRSRLPRRESPPGISQRRLDHARPGQLC